MEPLKLIVRRIDGSSIESQLSASLFEQLRALKARGYSGKRIINELIADDWGPPPRLVKISGIVDGSSVDEVIHYV